MKKRILKTNLELLGLQIFFAVLSMFFVEFFSWMQGLKWIYSLLTGWLFLGAVHSTFWQMGNKDYKNNVIVNNYIENESEKVKLSMLGGAKTGFWFFIINVIIVLATLVFDKGSGYGDVLFLIHRVMLFPLAGFLPETANKFYWYVCIILCVVMYIPCITAYISGAHNFSLTEKYVPKIIYKNPNKKD